MGKIRRTLKRIPIVESLVSFLEQLPRIYAWLIFGGGAVVSVALTAWAWLTENVPLPFLAVFFIVALAALLWLARSLIDIYRKWAADALDEKALGRDLIKLSQEMAAAIDDYQKDQFYRDQPRHKSPITLTDKISNPQTAYREWQHEVQAGNLMVTYVQSKFGHRIKEAELKLKILDIPVERAMHHRSKHNLMALANALGALGSLLVEGRVNTLREMDGLWYERLFMDA